jgi:hypothetical protein
MTTGAAATNDAPTPLQEDLVALLEATRRAEHDLFAALDARALTSPLAEEGWTAKDVRAHLAAWRSIEARRLLAASGVAAPEPSDPQPGDEVDGSNARIHADRSRWTPERVAAEAEASIDELIAAIRASSNDALCECDQIAAGIGANGVNHALGHLSDIARLADAGNRYAAFGSEVEEVLHRNHLLPRDSGVMLYNIACHSALTGRNDDARRLLATALARRADLRDYARDDPDLASVRPHLEHLLRS